MKTVDDAKHYRRYHSTPQFDEKNNLIGGCIGGSQGCALATVFISTALQKPINKDLAITGSISAEGRIGRVSGIKMKVIAAAFSGVKRVVIPKDNWNGTDRLFLFGLSKCKNINIYPVERYEEVYDIVFNK